MAKVIMHIDLNAFFATCEEIRHPDLAKKPLAIGGEGRSGIVSTANYVARKYGVHSGQPTFQAQAKCKDLVVLPPDFDYYRVMSHSFFALVRELSPIMEMASIDEAYVDMTKPLMTVSNPEAFLKNFQLRAKQETGLSCSIGISMTKWLAKMASDLKKPMGLVVIRRKDIVPIIYPLPIESFWGIGKKTSPYLREWGIDTIGKFAKALDNNDPLVLKTLGKFASTCKDWLAGKGDSAISTESDEQKSIGVSETLMHDITTPEEGEETLQQIAEQVAARAQKAKLVGRGLSVTIKDRLFALHQKSTMFDRPTNRYEEIRPKALALLREVFASVPDVQVRLIGVTLTRLEDEAHQTVQMSFWNYEEYEEMDQTKLLINSLNRKSGKVLLKRASEAKKDK